MYTRTLTSRRRFLSLAGGLAAGATLPAFPTAVLAAERNETKGRVPSPSPVENLMLEHGVFRRVLLIYEEAVNRINRGEELQLEVIADSAGIIRRFVEDYHDKLEEDEVFPHLKKAGKFDDLVEVLSVQHQAGRRLTDSILKLSEPDALKTPKAKQEQSAAMRQLYGGTPVIRWKGSKQELSSVMQQFLNMYRPHTAREDTVIFPAFRSVVSPEEFHELSEKFEDIQKKIFGQDGIKKLVESVGEIEKKLGIHELSKFTPKV